MRVNRSELVQLMQSLIAKEVELPMEDININSSFHSLGLDSISSMYMIEQLENNLKISISPLDFWDYPTINLLTEKITNSYMK